MRAPEIDQEAGEELRAHDYLYLDYLKEYNRRGPLDLRKFYFKFNRLCTIVLGAYICNVDLMGGLVQGREGDDCTKINHRRTIFNPLRWIPCLQVRRSTWRRELKMGWISYAVFALWSLLSGILIINTVYLYRHDIGRWRLKRVQELIGIHGPAEKLSFGGAKIRREQDHKKDSKDMTLGEFEQILQNHVNETRHTLRYLGDKFILWSVANECGYLIALAISVVTYLSFQWLYLWSNRPDIQLHRDHIDHLGEQKRVDARCRAEVLKYLESSLVYKACKQPPSEQEHVWFYEAGQQNLCDDGGQVRADMRIDSTSQQDGKRRCSSASGDKDGQMLMTMLAAGALRPISRSSSWIERRNFAQFALQINLLAYCIVFNIAALYVPFKSRAPGFDLGETCAILVVLLNFCAVIHHFTTLVLSCLEQIMLVNRVLSLIYECITLNQRQLELYSMLTLPLHQPTEVARRHDRQKAATIIDKINFNYLFTLMTYKNFVAQLVPFRRTNKSVFLIAFSLSFVIPVLAHIHAPYLEHDNRDLSPRQVRLFGLILSIVVLIPSNLICLPTCYVHSRCQRLYKALSSLLAHTTEVRNRRTGEAIYSEHAVCLLIKELSNPEQMLEQFVVQSLGLGGTFSSLVKLHFWWGLVAISMLTNSQDNHRNDMFGLLFSDPMGVWNFHVAPT